LIRVSMAAISDNRFGVFRTGPQGRDFGRHRKSALAVQITLYYRVL
jgi:hypothetical protein